MQSSPPHPPFSLIPVLITFSPGRGMTPPRAHLMGPAGADPASRMRLARPACCCGGARPCINACFSAAQSLVHAIVRRGAFGARGGVRAEGAGVGRGTYNGGMAMGPRCARSWGTCGHRYGHGCISLRPIGGAYALEPSITLVGHIINRPFLCNVERSERGRMQVAHLYTMM